MSRPNEPCTQLHVGGWAACIVVDGMELPLYGVEENDKKSTGCIASEEGKKFSIKWKVPDQSMALGVQIIIDGVWCGSWVYPSQKTRSGHSCWESVKYCYTSDTTKRPYTFARVETTDDDAYLDQRVSRKLGTIVLRIKEVIEERVLRISDAQPYTAQSKLATKIHERSKKGIGHQLRLGEEVVSRRKALWTRQKTAGTLAEFVFEYRPFELLRAEGKAVKVEEDTVAYQNILRLEAELEQAKWKYFTGQRPERKGPSSPIISNRGVVRGNNMAVDLTDSDSD